ncbi:hypothetical protein [Arthrobacter woluwensis]|uniref:Uncharacterized protein n=1 Tax=Arthrobacter woluwensis TaxID=156980 RepID=A0A1H4SE07_9MICC|nr:hypothetical protein [Arthrobacter woluwensis]SEC42416.1 hypothetical protein SAMN04489745_2835 [Arthrobacter woluwensis]
MSGFVIQYNRKSGELEDLETFEGRDGSRKALKRRLELEARRTDSDVEIVSLNARSLDEIKVTHSRYFSGGSLHIA